MGSGAQGGRESVVLSKARKDCKSGAGASYPYKIRVIATWEKWKASPAGAQREAASLLRTYVYFKLGVRSGAGNLGGPNGGGVGKGGH